MDKVLDLAKQIVEVLDKSEATPLERQQAVTVVRDLMNRDDTVYFASSPQAVARLIGEINKAVRDGAVLGFGS
jgi:hypothetical protein